MTTKSKGFGEEVRRTLLLKAFSLYESITLLTLIDCDKNVYYKS
jgi:hypothetical protein